MLCRIRRQLMNRHAEVLDRHRGQDGARARDSEAVSRAKRFEMGRHDIENRRAHPLGIDQEIMRPGQCRYSRIDLCLEFGGRARLPVCFAYHGQDHCILVSDAMSHLAHEFENSILIFLAPGDVLRDADNMTHTVEGDGAMVLQPAGGTIRPKEPELITWAWLLARHNRTTAVAHLFAIAGMDARHEEFERWVMQGGI